MHGTTRRIRTRLTELLGIEHPVMLAGMGGISYARLCAAVSEAGGFGCLGASPMKPAKLVAEMQSVRAATDKPFAVDLLTPMPTKWNATSPPSSTRAPRCTSQRWACRAT